MSKKLIIGVLSFFLLAGGIGVGVYLVQRNQTLQEQAAPASTIKLTPATKSSFIGEAVTVTADIDTTTNVATGATLDIKFSSDKLTLQSLEPGTALPVVLTPAVIDNAAGTASISLSAQPANPFQGKGTVATLKFAAKAAGSASVSFGQNTTARASQTLGSQEAPGTDILVNKIPTTLTILAQGETTPSPSPAVQASATPLASSSPLASATPILTPTPASGGTSATPSATTTVKPTVTLPASGKVVAGSTISGTAAANSTVTIVIKSQTITATVKADSTGKWSYKIPADLENGTHTITITDSNGTVTKSFVVTGSTASGSATSSAEVPVTGNELPTIVAAFAGIVLLFVGIAIAL